MLIFFSVQLGLILQAPSITTDALQDEQQIARNVQALKNRLRGRGGRRGGRGGRTGAASEKESHPNSEYIYSIIIFVSFPLTALYSSETPTKSKKAKTQRKWGDEVPTELDMASLDFSVDKPDAANGDLGSHDLQALVDQASLGTRTRDGLYEVKDWEFSQGKDNHTGNLIAEALKPLDRNPSSSTSSLGPLGSLFARLTGSKVLTKADLKPVLEGMKQHLMKKNVAMEIADKVCEGVGESLVGRKVGGFQSRVS